MCNGPPLVRFELGGAAVGQGRTSHDCLTISPYLVRKRELSLIVYVLILCLSFLEGGAHCARICGPYADIYKELRKGEMGLYDGANGKASFLFA